MPIPAAAAVVALIAADIGTPEQPVDPATLSSLTKIVERILDAVKLATVTVPGVGLVAPPGGAGGPVTGASTTGALS